MDITGSTLTPVIVSASRETDLPCFFSDWFVERLKEGWCAWKNTYSGTIHKVSFDKMRMIVFWSKNPRPLLRRLDEIEALGFTQYYFQFTLNDYEKEGFEPNVAPLDERIATFQELSGRIGKERVIWRFDPLVLANGIGVADLLERINRIVKRIKGSTEKLIFSFVDIGAYRKVSSNLSGTSCREFTPAEKTEFVKGLVEINREFGLQLATCAEDIDLSAYGIAHNKCVDDDLMMRLFHDDSELMDFIGAEYDLFSGWHIEKSKKDKGQRKACGCIVSKDIGAYNTCPHLCRYCYANASDAVVLENYKRNHASANSPML